MKFNYSLGKLPLIGIKLKSEDNEIALSSLIDTGADYTIFSRSIAERLGIKVEKGEMKVLEGAGGNIVAYIHNIVIIICDKEIKTDVCFSEKNDVPEHILGRKEVINNFKLVLSKDFFELIEHG